MLFSATRSLFIKFGIHFPMRKTDHTITEFFDRKTGMVYLRVNYWSERGASSMTALTYAEASAHLNTMRRKASEKTS